jgi:hypothetical protein
VGFCSGRSARASRHSIVRYSHEVAISSVARPHSIFRFRDGSHRRQRRRGVMPPDPVDKWRVLGPPHDDSIGMPRPATARMTGAPGNRPHRDPCRIFPNDPPRSIRWPGAVRILPHRSNKRFFGCRLDSDGQIDLSHAELVKLTPAQIDIEI